MTAGTTRDGTSKFSPYGPYGFTPDDDTIADGAIPSYGHENAKRYSGRHANPRGKAARKRAGKVVPVAAVAATLAAGTAAVFGLVGGGQPQASRADTSLALHGPTASAPAAGVGHANGATAAPVSVSTATVAGAAWEPRPARPAPAKPAPAAPKHTAASATALSCNLSYSMLPANVTAIVSFLLAHGYSHNAAAGIAGNIYQESKGNPESEGMGGGGLIGWTPLPSGFVTGNVTADLQTQLSALLTYNQGWSQYLPALNSAASPSDAASIYVTDFERAGIPAASTREASARNVAGACGI